MNARLAFTIIFIAIYSISIGAIGQTGVYRCGNSYSQKPCNDAVLVDVQDTRTAEQKVQADANIRRDTETGKTMEKERLAQEAQQRTAQAKLTAAEKKQSAPKPKKTASAANTADATAAKGKRKKSTESRKRPTPEVFTASAPADKTKPSTRPGKQH
nr:hypothetical protein [uncultured Rhodoferax sp.]